MNRSLANRAARICAGCVHPITGGKMVLLKIALMAAAVFAASGTPAQAEAWRHIGRDGPVQVAVDVDSFDGPQTRRTLRSALVGTAADDPFGFMILEAAIDCEARTIRGLSMGAYDLQGTLLRQNDLPADDGDRIQEGDGTAAVANSACDGAELAGRSFASPLDFAAWAKEQAAAQ